MEWREQEALSTLEFKVNVYGGRERSRVAGRQRLGLSTWLVSGHNDSESLGKVPVKESMYAQSRFVGRAHAKCEYTSFLLSALNHIRISREPCGGEKISKGACPQAQDS